VSNAEENACKPEPIGVLANLLSCFGPEGNKFDSIGLGMNEISTPIQWALVGLTHPDDGVLGQVAKIADLSANSSDLFCMVPGGVGST
jgi:hypothetical protein